MSDDETQMMVPVDELPEFEFELLEVKDEEEEEVEEETEEMEMVEPEAEDELQMVTHPGRNHAGQTHQKFAQIRDEKPAKKRKYMGKARRH